MSSILAAGAARMKLEAENYEARIAELEAQLAEAIKANGEQARLRGEAEGKLAASEMAGIIEGWKERAEKAEAQLAARTGGVKPLDEDDYEEIISAAAINMRKATSGIRGQVITVQDSFDWWVMKETERRILSALEPAAPNSAETMLSNLLARIHRDGGHYEAMNGTEKAVADADDIIAGIYADEPAVPEDKGAVGIAGKFGGMTRAVFDKTRVPVGTKLYTHPPAPPSDVPEDQPPEAWTVNITESDGRTYLWLNRSDGASAALSCRTNNDSGETIASQVAKEFTRDYTRPSEQAVTEAMVEAAWAVISLHHPDQGSFDEDRSITRAALKAAMEAGR